MCYDCIFNEKSMLNCKNITEKQYFMKQNTSNYTHFGTMELIGSSQSNMAETDVHSCCILGVVNNAIAARRMYCYEFVRHNISYTFIRISMSQYFVYIYTNRFWRSRC